MVSTELAALRGRVWDLRRRLLPSRWPLLASDAQSERARAFTLLAHAEVETYLEEMVLGYADRRVTEWIRGGPPSMCIVGLAKAAIREVAEVDKDKRSTRDVVLLGKRQLSEYLKIRNHGVREKQLRRMFLPIGMELTSLPLGFPQSLEAWGIRRGGFAHQGGYVNIPNPKGEYDDARQILAYLMKIDRTLRA